VERTVAHFLNLLLESKCFTEKLLISPHNYQSSRSCQAIELTQNQNRTIKGTPSLWNNMYRTVTAQWRNLLGIQRFAEKHSSHC